MGRLKGGELLIDATELGDITQLNVGGSTGIIDIRKLFNFQFKSEPDEYVIDIQKRIDEILYNKKLRLKVKVHLHNEIVEIIKSGGSIYESDARNYYFIIPNKGTYQINFGHLDESEDGSIGMQIELNSSDA